MMRLEITSHDNLAVILTRAGHPLELRCGGLGRCGRCSVRLLSGIWLVRNVRTEAPAEAPACMTFLASEKGEIEFSPAQQQGQISTQWHGAPLPATEAPVIGIDLGTTTVAAAKAEKGRIVSRAAAFNRQMQFGDNVLTRITRYAEDSQLVRAALLDTVESLLDRLGTERVQAIAVAGNTVLSSIFHGIDPAPIGQAPFQPLTRTFPVTTLRKIPLYTMPCISGFVGGDLTAGLAECRLQPGEMLVDVGTNCEIIFATPSGMVCSSAAAGAAFEGAGIACGGRAETGAIDHFFTAGNYSVIGGGKAQTVCGSGLIDFLAVSRQEGKLDHFGRLIPAASHCEIAPGVTISEAEIAEILKAKSAVFAGISSLEAHCRCTAQKIFLAGGFAQYLNVDSAVRIGMLPQRQYEIVGNTSLAGALRLASQPETLTDLVKLTDLPVSVPLNLLPDFEMNFVSAMQLP